MVKVLVQCEAALVSEEQMPFIVHQANGTGHVGWTKSFEVRDYAESKDGDVWTKGLVEAITYDFDADPMSVQLPDGEIVLVDKALVQLDKHNA